MGMTAEAILVYGVDFGEGEDNWPECFRGGNEPEGGSGIIGYCYYGYKWNCLAVTLDGSYSSVERGAKAIESSKMDIDPDKLQKAQRFCEKHGIDFSDPKWLLCASYC